MKIYVASSWRNKNKQQSTVMALRTLGHEVYDFCNPSIGTFGFSWNKVASSEQLLNPRRFRTEVLTNSITRQAFYEDMYALRNSECTLLVLPCGRSAHLELGYATSAGKLTIVLLDNPVSEPELMYLMCDHICITIDEVAAAISEHKNAV